jgi:tetratricopeptide (TPR) repeat protein
MKTLSSAFLAAVLLPLSLFADPATAQFEKDLKALDQKMADGKPTVQDYSRRGDLRFFLGRFEEAVADYEKMIELEKDYADTHWRLGIAYYFAGEFKKSAELFERYHAHDNVDRETALWHMLALAGQETVGHAQLQMLAYSRPDREPFELLYDMFAGVISIEEMFREIQKRQLFADQKVMFYARFYSGIYANVTGKADDSKKFLRMAVESDWGKKAGGGPGFMYQVARIVASAISGE